MNIIEKRKRMRGQGGFTLIELLVVVAILAILAGVAVFAVGNLTKDAGANACKLEKDTLKAAIASAKATSAADDWFDYVNDGNYADAAAANATVKYWSVGAGPGFALTRTNTGEVPPGDCS